MTIVRNLFGTLLALLAMAMAVLMLGQRKAMIYSLAIAMVAMIVKAVERRTTKPVERGSTTTEYARFGALWAVIALWTAISILGPRDIAGPFFGVIFTVIVIVTAMILSVALKREPFTTVTGAGDAR